MVKIAVLGCGPAGLMAAHGAVEAALMREGGEITIFSRKQKSTLFGAQYLHRPIPDMTLGEARTIHYQMIGESADYRRKVYGQRWLGAVSPEDLEGDHQGWDIRATYDNLWERYSGAIADVDIDPVGLKDLLDGSDFDVVFNSVPRTALCYQGHAFDYVNITAAGDAPALGIDIGSMYKSPDDTVTCNGNAEPSWYRLSRVFGHTTVEWPESIERIPINTAALVPKPTGTTCDCWPTITNVGRYGTWEKGVLSHTAYEVAYDEVAALA